jgi:large subunit ribosomal protein L22
MQKTTYKSYQGDMEKTAVTYGRELDISYKGSNEICYTIKGMMINKALSYLEDVLQFKDHVPYRRYYKGKAHRKTVRKGVKQGGYPLKATKAVIKLLKGIVSNAEQKGLEKERLKIVHAAATKGRVIPRARSRAWGSGIAAYHMGTMSNITLTNIEFVVKQV